MDEIEMDSRAFLRDKTKNNVINERCEVVERL
jgi:hypothetical protein